MHRRCYDAILKACQEAGRPQLQHCLRGAWPQHLHGRRNIFSNYKCDPCQAAASLAAKCNTRLLGIESFGSTRTQLQQLCTMATKQPAASGFLRHAEQLSKHQHNITSTLRKLSPRILGTNAQNGHSQIVYIFPVAARHMGTTASKTNWTSIRLRLHSKFPVKLHQPGGSLSFCMLSRLS